jgi:hypothetical protein
MSQNQCIKWFSRWPCGNLEHNIWVLSKCNQVHWWWGHYFDMGMIIARGAFFFFFWKILILKPYMVQKNKMPKDLAHLVMEKKWTLVLTIHKDLHNPLNTFLGTGFFFPQFCDIKNLEFLKKIPKNIVKISS